MNYRLEVKTEAIADMTVAFEWYEDKRTGLGTEFLNEVELYFDRIIRNPAQYKSFRNERIAVLHRFPYKVVFEIEKDCIVVYAVYHDKRDPETMSERLI